MDRKLLFSIVLAVTTVWLFQYYMGSNQNTGKPGVVSVSQTAKTVPGRAIKVPTVEELHKPLNFNVVFTDEKISQDEKITTIETDLVVARFSNFGGILSSIDFKEHTGKNNKPLRTVYEHGGYDDVQRKKGSFLLAFEEKTPYFYKLVDKKRIDNKEIITYQAESSDWIIKKIYEIYNDSYKLDLSIEFEPKSDKAGVLRPRILFAAPYIHEFSGDTVTPFVLNDSSQTIEKKSLDEVQGMAWYWATSNVIFGAEDKYFAHALVKDPSKFVQRAYFKKIDAKNFFPILEGPTVSEKSGWTMSFYMGPKLYDHLTFIDEKLGDILSFGWLSWFCKIILKLLDYIYQYVGNYGVAIILLSVLLRIPFVPLSIYSRQKSVGYQKHQPFLERIRAKYRKDPQKLQHEVMRYHKDHNLSPMTPMIGCLPLLIQAPILFSLYRVLGNYLDLYQAPFFGWIVDLSSKDPYYVIPVLMGVSMLWQQHVMPTGGDGKQKVVGWFMSIMMIVVFSGFPVGLVLYWFMNNILTVGEDYLRKAFLKTA